MDVFTVRVQTGAAPSFTLISSFLREHRDDLIRQWEALVCAGPCEVRLSGAPLRDHLPAFLDELADWMERQLLEDDVGVNPRIEVRLVRLNGEERTVEANAAAFDDAEGRVIEAVLRDVTEHKRAGEALRASEERLRAHIDNSPLAVIEFDPQFCVTRWSQEGPRRWSAWTSCSRRGL